MKKAHRRTLDVSKLSPGVLALNPHLAVCAGGASQLPQDCVSALKAPDTARKGKKRREMNRTEAEFSRHLERKLLAGEIVSYDYEGMTLRFGDLKYTPDFVAIESVEGEHVKIVFYEVKGGHIFDAGLVRWKAAKHNYPLFRFEMWQKKKGEWGQIH